MNNFLLVITTFLITVSSFAQIRFEKNIIVDDSYVINPKDALFGDIDNDGDMDIMAAGGRNVVWFENIDGLGTYGKRKLIANYPIGDSVASPFLVDLDGDGDLEAIASSIFMDKIMWYENLDGLGNFGPEQVIANFSAFIFASDIDTDGDMDILVSYSFEEKIGWLENLDGLGNFSNTRIIDVDVPNVRSLKTADLDGDGDVDILLTSFYENKVIWYENLNGNGNFGPQKIILADRNEPTSVYAADLDNDGDLDIVSTSGFSRTVGWQENIDGNGNFGALQTIDTNVEGALGLNVADIDNDGDMDVFVADMVGNTIAFYENLDGLGTFSAEQIISNKVNMPFSTSISDVDNDGYLDVLCVSLKDAKITWYKNTDGLGNFGAQNIIHEDIDNLENIIAADIDGDGDMDIISASHNPYVHSNSIIAWFENLDGHGNFEKPKAIDYPGGAKFVRATDVDGDGDLDIIVGTFSSSSKVIIWYENLDGNGNFGEANDISNGLYQLTSLEIADFDGDSDNDILFTTTSSFGWIENLDGLGNYGLVHLLSPINSSFESIAYPADLDNDGDMDIISWRFNRSGQVIWLENLDGTGNFNPHQLIFDSTGGGSINNLKAADMDGDGDVDIILGSTNPNEHLLWVENLGNGNFGDATSFNVAQAPPTAIFLGDLDNDNDIDVVFASQYERKYGWKENLDGQGNFGSEIILSSGSLEPVSVFISDLDGDGDNDIVAASRLQNEIVWFENSPILSLYENNNLKFSAFPIPTNDFINIQSETTIAIIKIYNSLGQLVLSKNDSNTVDVSSLQSGIYFLNTTDNKGNQGTIRIIKK